MTKIAGFSLAISAEVLSGLLAGLFGIGGGWSSCPSCSAGWSPGSGSGVDGAESPIDMRPVQAELFSTPAILPEGMAYGADVLTRAEESGLGERLGELDLKPFEFHGYEGNRRVASFGLQYDFASGALRAGKPNPDFLWPLRETAARFAALQTDMLPHVLVTEYRPGAGIGWHKDRPVFGEVIGVSLLSECRFRLRRRSAGRWERASLVLAPRSVYLLSGPARREWEHSIPAGGRLRYSVTFRSLCRDENR